MIFFLLFSSLIFFSSSVSRLLVSNIFFLLFRSLYLFSSSDSTFLSFWDLSFSFSNLSFLCCSDSFSLSSRFLSASLLTDDRALFVPLFFGLPRLFFNPSELTTSLI
uniref:Uncharacterized protein n=1 Tax=Cacopsylla melanoneura TaxID=428564 RepID=A0A8D9BHT8_9HEMI